MATRRYLNFDLLLEQEGEGRYQARVTDSPLGETPSVHFALPFDATTLENLLLKLDPGRTGTRRVGSNPMQQAAMDFGGPLYQAIFTGDLGVAWTRSLDRVRSENAGGLRLRLRLNDAPAIAGLPWELLYDARSNSFIAQSERTPLVRFLDVPEVPKPMAVDGPLRVLAIISSPTDLDELDVEAEWTRLRDALSPRLSAGLVVLDRLPSPTLSELGTWLRRSETHVVHFVGHGDFDEGLREGVIYFQDETGRRSPVTASTLGPYLRDHDPLRMVVLNACRSARTDSIDPFGGMAQGLVQQDASAVVAMQFPISDKAAVKFTGEFYGALVDGLPVDQAVSSARKALLDGFRDEWATPVLFLRAPDGNIFENVHAAAGAVPTVPVVPGPVGPGPQAGTVERGFHPAAGGGAADGSPGGGGGGPGRTQLIAGGVAGVVVLAILAAVFWPRGDDGGGRAGDQDPSGATSGAKGSSTDASDGTPTENVEGLPAGTKLTFEQLLVAAGPDANNLHVWKVDLSTGTAEQVTHGTRLEQGPVIGPNRDTIVFTQVQPNDVRALRAAATDGTGERALFANPPTKCLGQMERPAWPRGAARRVVLVCREPLDKDPHLLLLGFDGVVQREYPVEGQNFGDPAITPDGQTLMYWANEKANASGGFLWQVPVDGGTATQITTDEIPGDDDAKPDQDSDAVFSPDGALIAFRRTDADGNRDIWVADADGSNPRQLTTSPQADQDPTFSPHSDAIAFKHDETDGTTRIYVVPVAGGDPQPLLPKPIDIIEALPAWSRR